MLNAVIALPPGAAPPHGVALHLWVLRSPESADSVGTELLFVDAAQSQSDHAGGPVGAGGAGKASLDWTALSDTVRAAVRAHSEPRAGGAGPAGGHEDRPGTKAVPVIDLLDDQVDLTPARHVPVAASVAGAGLRTSWCRFDGLLEQLSSTAAGLSPLELSQDAGSQGSTTVGELARAGALTLHAGQSPAEGTVTVREGTPADDSVLYLTIQDLLLGSAASGWLTPGDVAEGHKASTLTLTEPTDVVVVGSSRVFDAWVDTDGPTALGPQIHALRADASVIDPWFLAGCLRAPANARQAGTHASTASRIDVRRLQIPRLPLGEQRRYGEVFRRLTEFERLLRESGGLGAELIQGLSDGLSAGRLSEG
ncbi:MAG TPA: hypothetical protein DEQ61_12060 [Streptomyces sp.]|nr:hypothetical protein [Streptomyces sp.]